MDTNLATVGGFFTQYHHMCGKFDMYIWNYDESGVQDIPKEEDGIGVTGKKAQYQGHSDRG